MKSNIHLIIVAMLVLSGCRSPDTITGGQAGTLELSLEKEPLPLWLTDMRLYIDGAFIGTHGPEDRKPVFSLSPGWHRIRVEGQTYKFRDTEPYSVFAEDRLLILGGGVHQFLEMQLMRED